jgi:long-chain acyl-CoA synthetase
VILTLAPLYRLGGLGVTVLPGLFKGATIVVTPETGPAEILDIIERHRVTVLFGAPALFQEIEKVLINHPDVGDCAVAGIPVDGKNIIVAFVVLSANETNSVEQLNTYLAHELPSAKVPQRYQLIEEIPRNPNGKILRQKLFELYTME